ncbi:MAG: hypothetical protein R3B74_14730 [Nitrospirales bacterium]|nr:hypothetical protein [Nitrospirales bacterium]
MKISACRISLALFMFIIFATSVGAHAQGAPPEPSVQLTSTTNLIHRAAQAADHAWEEFHRAAIEGTLASPAIQVAIENQLHEVRALLMEARRADRAQQFNSVKIMTEKIFIITQHIVQASQERKI